MKETIPSASARKPGNALWLVFSLACGALSAACSHDDPKGDAQLPSQTEEFAQVRAALEATTELRFRITGVKAWKGEHDANEVDISVRTNWDVPPLTDARTFACGDAYGPTFNGFPCTDGPDEDTFHPYPGFLNEWASSSPIIGSILSEGRHIRTTTDSTTFIEVDVDLNAPISSFTPGSFRLDIDPTTGDYSPDVIGSSLEGFRHEGALLGENTASHVCDSTDPECALNCVFLTSTYELCYEITSCTPGTDDDCDGKDNDCDGLIDEDFTTVVSPCGPPGECAGTVTTSCVEGKIKNSACEGVTGPTPEICDGLDNDCNGVEDDAGPELCGDGQDNDCDKSVDEIEVEVCDGIDNDCDTFVDEGNLSDLGSITCPGIGCELEMHDRCIEGKIEPAECPDPDPAARLCNGVDDDCSGRVDDRFENTRVSVVDVPGQSCVTTTTFCLGGKEGDALEFTGDGSPESLDGIDNDCDGLIDECNDGETAWWCDCTGQTISFNVDLLDDVIDPDTAAAGCEPFLSTESCSLRGVFRRAEQLDYLGCPVEGILQADRYEVDAELRLASGDLVLSGAGGELDGECEENAENCVPSSTTITSLSPCKPPKNKDDFGACHCVGQVGEEFSTHRLINAIGGQDRPATDNLPAALSLSLELDDLILKGGSNKDVQGESAATASGGVVISRGSLIVNRIAVADNRARGVGAGIAAFDAKEVRITDSVIRDNYNTQSITVVATPAGFACRYNGNASGRTGAGGGVYLQMVTTAEINRTAIVGNSAPDGGGLRVNRGAGRGGSVTVRNSTITDNHVRGGGGGIWTELDTALFFNTIAHNSAGEDFNFAGSCDRLGAGLYIQGANLEAYGNIIAENRLPGANQNDDCRTDSGIDSQSGDPCPEAASIVGAGFNWIGDSTPGVCAALFSAPGTPSGDPKLVPSDPSSFSRTGSSPSLAFELAGDSGAREAYPLPTDLPAGAPACADATQSVDQTQALRPVDPDQCSLGAWDALGTVAGFTASQLVSGVYASEWVTLSDRARVFSNTTAQALALGFDAVISGDVRSLGTAFLEERATVTGDAVVAAELTGDREGVLGTLFENQSVFSHELPVREVGSTGAGLEVPYDGSVPLSAGDHGAVLVHSRGTLELTEPGVYRFSSLTFEADAFLKVSGDFAVAVAVDGDLILGSRFEMELGGANDSDSRKLFLYSSGALVRYGHDSIVVGNLEAPLASVEVQDRSVVRGSVRGRNVTLGFDTVVGPRAPLPPAAAPQP